MVVLASAAVWMGSSEGGDPPGAGAEGTQQQQQRTAYVADVADAGMEAPQRQADAADAVNAGLPGRWRKPSSLEGLLRPAVVLVPAPSRCWPAVSHRICPGLGRDPAG